MNNMSNFYTEQELKSLGLAAIGKDVKISKKASLYGISKISVDDHSRIDDFCIVSAGEKGIKIGKFVHIACHTTLIGKERIEIGDLSTLSGHCSVYSSSDDYSGASLVNPTVSEKYKKVDYRPVNIGRNVVVGAHSTILPGSSIGNGCSVGAYSLVNGNIKEGMIAIGIPCKEIKERKKDYLKLEKEFLKEAGY